MSPSLPTATVADYSRTDKEIRAQSLSLLRNRQTSDDMTILEAMDDEHLDQREHAAIHGGCEMGCDSSQLIECRPGVVVCNWTREPCQRSWLSKLIELYSPINRNCRVLITKAVLK